jgi:hypothetical protein
VSESANINSVEAVTRFLALLRDRQERAGNILAAHQQEMHRVLDWFEQELPYLWKQELRRRYDRVSMTRTEYENCKRRAMTGERPSCHQEKMAYERARQRLREAEQKADEIKRWRTRFAQEADECRGRLGKFQHFLDADLRKTIALIERMVQSLEGYIGRTLSSEENPPEE